MPEPTPASATFIFNGDLDLFARVVVGPLSPHQAEELLDAVRRWVATKRKAIDDVGSAIGLH